MKHRSFYQNFIIALLGTFLLGGCSSSSDNPSAAGGPAGPTSQSISGIVSDPAIDGAGVTLVNLDGTPVDISGITGSDGKFNLTEVQLGDLSTLKLITKDGADTGTGQDFHGITLSLALAMYTEYDSVVVSPLTSLVVSAFDGSDINAAITEIQGHLGEFDLKADPGSDPALLALAMKTTLIAGEGKSFNEIHSGLDENPGIDSTDLAAIFSTAGEAETKARLEALFTLIDDAVASGSALPPVYQKALIETAIREALASDLADLTDLAEIANSDANIDKVVAQLIILKADASRHYLMKSDVVSTIMGGGGLTIDRLIADPAEFDPASFSKVVLVNSSATFNDSLNIAYYRVDNPVTGNEQLVVFDGVTQQQTVVKTNVILGSRTFVLEGSPDGDKRVISGKKYGILLDPNLSQELRSAPNGFGGFFQYTFFFDNAFKRFDVASPSVESVIFNSSMLPSSLTTQGVGKIANSFTLHNNTNDADNSYVDLSAFEELPDLFKGQTGDDTKQAPVVVRLVDGNVTQGRLVRILKDAATGLTSRVLINFEAVHTPSSAVVFDTRLQVCDPDLSGCADVLGGTGGFSTLAENSTHVYLGKKGESTLYAFDKSAESLNAVTGAQYPAAFDPDQHLIGASGHGGGGIISDFSSINGANTYLSDGDNAYLAINYDLDRNTKVGEFMFLGPIFMQKHAQILKLTGKSGVKMFDNGDGIDHGDTSSDAATMEDAKGHVNLIAVKNGKLFVELANYDGVSAGGTCIPNPFGYNCFSVRYGYLNTDNTVVKTVLDTILVEKENLRFMTARRIAPVAMNDRLFVSILNVQGGRGEPHTYTLHRFDLLSETVAELTATVGRSFMTKTAERDNGIFEGEVIAWDSETKVLANVTGNILDLGSPEGVITAAGDTTAITSVFGRTSGVPLAGTGNLVALRGMPNSHDWHLLAGEVSTEGGLVHVDQVPTSSWIYE